MKINRNIFWTETFVNELISAGVKYVCISPGSRNTPLTYAFAGNKKIKPFLIIDERSSGFFALGLAKSSNSPVAVVCTSGTATAELYPAIIEAYQQRVPLIICTADRPPELLDVGANQTINQNNLYRNHIRWFVDVGLPEPIPRRIKHIKAIARRAYYESMFRSKGPVHLNFPFRKPFEPKSFTDEITSSLYKISKNVHVEKQYSNFENKLKETKFADEEWFKKILRYIKKSTKGLIIAGPANYDDSFSQYCYKFSLLTGFPIIADGASQLRFGKKKKTNVIANFEGLFRSDNFTKKYKPDLIIQFGRTITSKGLDLYLEKSKSPRFLINEYGDWFDPSNRAAAAYTCKPYLFCREAVNHLSNDIGKVVSTDWLNAFQELDKKSFSVKKKIIQQSKFPNETRIIPEIVSIIPEGSNLMISNSMPIRDFDYFAQIIDKDFFIYNNRGASGIDGIISTAMGIYSSEKRPTVLLTGDLAFYYDMNSLLSAKRHSIPLIIILINNNGGGIFEILPISGYGKLFKDFFIAPHDLNFKNFVESYGGNFKKIISWEDFRKNFLSAFKANKFSVLEIKTDAVKSHQLRLKYWNEVAKKIN